MQSENAIEVRKLTKKFKVYYDKGNSLKEKVLFKSRNKYEERWVLNGISFNVKKGEAIGLIGHNGCGKSTTLKLLNRIIYPTDGEIEMQGRVSSLIELGAGFHPDMSGRENIYINASIFGLTKKEIDERIDDIIAFSELEDYMDNPVRTYSSGMYMRLAFAVAINVDADILLIDEILAVGDANFQAKCFNKLREIKGKGVTIVIVSHSLGQIEQICDRSIWIDKGVIREEGSPVYVHPLYLEYMMGKEDNNRGKNLAKNIPTSEKCEERKEEINGRRECGNKEIEILDISIENEKGNKDSFRIGDDIKICVKYRKNNLSEKDIVIGYNIIRNDGVYCYGTTTQMDKLSKVNLKPEGSVCIIINDIRMLRGIYTMDIAFANPIVGVNYHYIYKAIEFEVKDDRDDLGVFRLDHEWKID